MMTETNSNSLAGVAIPPDTTGDFPELMVEAELIAFLRIPVVSKAGDYHHVIEHLKRMRGLPCLHIAKQPLYFLPAVREWIQREVDREGGKR